MKHYNFTHYNTTSSEVDCSTRVTFTAPEDFVGRLYLTRFKLSSSSFPLLALYPSKKEFTAEEKLLYDDYTPTDYGFIMGCPGDVNYRNGYYVTNGWRIAIDGNNNNNSVALRAMPKDAVESPDVSLLYFCSCNIKLPRAPQWIKNENDKYTLVQEPYLIYSWNEFYKLLNVYAAHGISYFPLPRVELSEVSENKIKISFYDTIAGVFLTPIFMPTPEFATLFNLTDKLRHSIIDPEGLETLKGWDKYIGKGIFYVLDQPLEFGEVLNQLTMPTTTSVFRGEPDNYGFPVVASVTLSYIPENIFPVNALIVTAPDLAIESASISVDTHDTQGVVSPSQIAILKLFLIGLEGGKTGDFLYSNDSLTSDYHEINEPRKMYATIKCYYLLKDSRLIELKLQPQSTLFVQLGLKN